MGDAPGAMEALRRELAINPNHFDSHLLLALLLRQDSKNDEALAHLQQGARAAAGRPRRAATSSRSCTSPQAELEPARRTARAARGRGALGFSEAHVSLATVYYRLGRREDGNREQQIVQRLKAEQKAREDAEKAQAAGHDAAAVGG